MDFSFPRFLPLIELDYTMLFLSSYFLFKIRKLVLLRKRFRLLLEFSPASHSLLSPLFITPLLLKFSLLYKLELHER